jgi:uncharacterized protein (TIGR02246 family)
MADLERVLHAYFDGLNAEDYAGVAALFAEDGQLAAVGSRPRRGRDEIRSYFEAALRPYPVHRDTPTRILLSGDAATVEITFTGETATGAPLTFDAVDVFDFDADGRIVRLTSWYDSYAVRKQLADAG